MARISFSVGGVASAPSASRGNVDGLQATVTSTLATLVADGATPTEAHVTAVNDAYTALVAAQAANAVLSIDGAVVTTRNRLKAALDAILQAAAGDGTLTP